MAFLQTEGENETERVLVHKNPIDIRLKSDRRLIKQTLGINKISKQIKKLKYLKATLEEKEKFLYNKFNVDNIQQLNIKVAECQRLLNFNDQYDKYLPPRYGTLRTDQILKDLNKGFADQLSEFGNREELINTIVSSIAAETENKKFRSNDKYISDGKIDQDKIKTILKNYLQKGDKGFEFGRGIVEEGIVKGRTEASRKSLDTELKRRIKVALNNLQLTNDGCRTKVELNMNNNYNDNDLIYKGYVNNLGNNQTGNSSTNKDNRESVNIVRESLAKILSANLENSSAHNMKQYVYQAVANMPEGSLYVYTLSDFKGLIGEVQAGIIEMYLTNGTGAGGKQSGGFISGGKKISIDLLIEDAGFQVKNYNIVKNSIDPINFVDSSATHFISKIDVSERVRKMMREIYAFNGFNQQYTEAFTDTREKIEQSTEDMENIYSLFTNEVMHFSQTMDQNSQDTYGLEPICYNTFFVIGGTPKVFIPSSQIIDCFIKALTAWENKQMSKESLFSISREYTGPRITDKKEWKNLPTIHDVAEKMKIRIAYKFDVGYYLNQVVSQNQASQSAVAF